MNGGKMNNGGGVMFVGKGVVYHDKYTPKGDSGVPVTSIPNIAPAWISNTVELSPLVYGGFPCKSSIMSDGPGDCPFSRPENAKKKTNTGIKNAFLAITSTPCKILKKGEYAPEKSCIQQIIRCARPSEKRNLDRAYG